METFSIYNKLDELNISKLMEFAKGTNWPKGKRYAVNCNGVEIKVQTYLAKAGEKMPDYGYDAYAAIESMYVRELKREEILWENNGEPQFADPQFNTKELISLNSEQIIKRTEFITAIADLINNQETMTAIVQAAAKKKNGTLHKNRVVRIACSGVASFLDHVYAIIARAKTDNTLSITFEEVLCKPGDNKVWAVDFISTYHQGLPVSEALKYVLQK